MMKIFVIVGHNRELNNTSARAAFRHRSDAEAWIKDPERNFFDDLTVIVELDLEGREN